jgi:hypothetical protein
MPNHTFSYTGNLRVKILNFRYGNSRIPHTYVEDTWLAADRIPQSGEVTGAMPIGDSLYVKWQVEPTGAVYEKWIDFKDRLPSDMDGKIIRFIFLDGQINVYLIEGNTPGKFHASGAPDCPDSPYRQFRCTRLYPDRWTNF